jgi:hypothetical protein
MGNNIKKILTNVFAAAIGSICMLTMINFFGFEDGVIGALGFILAKLFLNDLKK